MRQGKCYLVVGGDSLVGQAVAEALRRRGKNFYVTTRRSGTTNAHRIYLDLEGIEDFVAPSDASYAFVIAAATNYERCENDPLARVINVELVPRLIASLLDQDMFVTFISTNSVFGGERPWPNEEAPHAPGIAYAEQKSEGERAINEIAVQRAAHDRLNIVRLTKILTAGVPPLPDWLKAWRSGEAVSPFSDLKFAPLSADYTSDSLVTIGEKHIPGMLHLSGAENVSYVDLAHAMAHRLGIDPLLVQPTTATEKGVRIAFKPTYSGLGMDRTTELSGITPQPLSSVIEDIFPEAGQGSLQ